MSRSLAELGNDPDIEILKNYNIRKEQKRENKGQKVLKKRRIEATKWLVLPGCKVSVSAQRIQYTDTLEYQSLNKSKQNKSADLPVATTHHTRAANEVISILSYRSLLMLKLCIRART